MPGAAIGKGQVPFEFHLQESISPTRVMTWRSQQDAGRTKVSVRDEHSRIRKHNQENSFDGQPKLVGSRRNVPCRYPYRCPRVARRFSGSSKGGSSGGHYNSNAETYMNVGEAMGKAMVELLQNEK